MTQYLKHLDLMLTTGATAFGKAIGRIGALAVTVTVIHHILPDGPPAQAATKLVDATVVDLAMVLLLVGVVLALLFKD